MRRVSSLPRNTKLRSSKYLNNLIERDHRGVKQRVAVMLGFKQFRNAVITIAGIELMHRISEGTIRTAASCCSRRSCAYNLEGDTGSLRVVQRTRYACPHTADLHHSHPRLPDLRDSCRHRMHQCGVVLAQRLRRPDILDDQLASFGADIEALASLPLAANTIALCVQVGLSLTLFSCVQSNPVGWSRRR